MVFEVFSVEIVVCFTASSRDTSVGFELMSALRNLYWKSETCQSGP